MEYLAFGLLGLGTIFIFIGILSARDNANKKAAKSEFDDKLPTDTTVLMQTAAQPTLKNPQQPFQHVNVPDRQIKQQVLENKIPCNNIGDNALLFSQESTLYIDKSGNNIYDSSKKNPSLINASAIHRIGQGNLSYNGFTFYFSNDKGKEVLHLTEIEKMNFFPNCVTFTKKQSTTTLIFFIDNTKHLKSLLDKHLMPHAAQ